MYSRNARKLTLWCAVTVLGIAGLGWQSAVGSTVYVSTNSPSPASPYDNWTNAAQTLATAIAYANANAGVDTVLLTNGTYSVAAEQAITRAYNLQSVNGATATVVQGNGAVRLITVTGAGAVIQGLTFLNGLGGAASKGGGAIVINADTTIRKCVFRGNNSPGGGTGDGGAIQGWSGMGLIETCVFAGNHADRWGGALETHTAASTVSVVNCTMTRNDAGTDGGAVYRYLGVIGVTNSIVFGDRNSGTLAVNNYGGTVSFASCCSLPSTTGVTVTNAPSFYYDGDNYGTANTNGDFHLRPDSPCLDAANSGLAPATDFEGNGRLTDGNGDGTNACDIGAYEMPDFTNGALRCGFTVSRTSGLAPMTATSAVTRIAGAHTNIQNYAWTFGDGQSTNGASLPVVVNACQGGTYHVVLALSNDFGEVATFLGPLMVVSPATVYVSTNGSQTSPYDTWAKAATNLQTAVSAGVVDGTNATLVLVSNGTYRVAPPLTITAGVAVRSVNGPLFTALSGDGVARVDGHVVWIRDQAGGAVLDGFTITNGYSSGGGMDAGGVQFDASCTIRNCIVMWNRSSEDAGGISSHAGAGTGRLVNCVIAGNRCGRWGGGVHTENGTMILEHCTLTGNTADGINGGTLYSGGAYMYSGTLSATNTISYNNSGAVGYENYYGVTFRNSCATPLPAGTGNIATNPLFVGTGLGYGLSFSNGNFHLGAGSPCIDTGMSNALLTDVEGNVRPTDGNGDGTNQWDMGAYEAPTFGSGPLQVSFIQDRTSGFPLLPVVFTVTSVSGSNTNGLYFRWTFGDGNTTNGASLRVVTNLYALGTFQGMLVLSNSAAELATNQGALITVVPSDVYVAPNGSHTSPFDTWAKAATNIQAAIDASGASGTNFATFIHVTNGTYDVPAPNYYINFNKAVTMQSVNGPAYTVLRGAGVYGYDQHVVWIRSGYAGAVIRGFTITNGYSWDGGGIEYDSDCTIQDCIVVGNRANEDGGGIASHENLSLTSIGQIRNCLVIGNEAVRWGGGLYTENAGSRHVIENCTVTRNRANTGGSGDGGGIYRYQGSITATNSIIYNNIGGSTTTNYGGGGITFGYSCTLPLPAGTGNIASDPLFVNAGGGYGATFTNGDFRLGPGSPCIDAGTNALVHTTADLVGNPRIARRGVDMGVYEVQPPKGTYFLVR